ncbi:MAG: OadG family protein [Muribaculum sp.]|nr:OadG family protein [Muribaculum sp.]
MKKFLVLTCMIACIFGMTACSGDKELTEYEQQKVSAAESKATNLLIPYIQSLLSNPENVELLKEYTPEEVESIVNEDVLYSTGGSMGFEVDGNAFISALDSFAAAYEEIGGTGEVTGVKAKIDGKQIIVNVSVQGPVKNATAEIVFTNDRFLKLEAASLNQNSTMKDSMLKAVLNTLLGMGTVFAVLILISLIISCFGIFSKIPASTAKEDRAAVAKPAAQPVVQASEELSDDLELVAVIAAAIAASEGAASTDGFVVRSIKRRRVY